MTRNVVKVSGSIAVNAVVLASSGGATEATIAPAVPGPICLPFEGLETAPVVRLVVGEVPRSIVAAFQSARRQPVVESHSDCGRGGTGRGGNHGRKDPGHARTVSVLAMRYLTAAFVFSGWLATAESGYASQVRPSPCPVDPGAVRCFGLVSLRSAIGTPRAESSSARPGFGWKRRRTANGRIRARPSSWTPTAATTPGMHPGGAL